MSEKGVIMWNVSIYGLNHYGVWKRVAINTPLRFDCLWEYQGTFYVLQTDLGQTADKQSLESQKIGMIISGYFFYADGSTIDYEPSSPSNCLF